jgi:DNA-binding NarL/FixJ family response regulator
VPALRVLVGEDSFLVREGLVRALHDDPRVDVVGSEGDAPSLLAAVQELRPDVVVTDIRMPPTKTDEGIAFANALAKTHPEIGVVVLSEHAQIGYATQLFADGGSGRAYLLKDRIVDEDVLIDAIDAVAHGTAMVDPRVVSLMISANQHPRSGLESLTDREEQVLERVASGQSNASIAEELALTRRAVERHINAVFSKLELVESESVNRRVVAALLYARSRGLQ